MKRVLLLFILLIGITTLAFTEAETWLSVGFEYANFWESASDDGDSIKGYIGSPGIDLSSYTFWDNSNVGVYVHSLFAFPVKITSEFNGVKTEADLDVYDYIVQIGMLIGPGFRINITDDFKLHFGIGVSLLFTTAQIDGDISYHMYGYNLGIGGNIGIKYNITKIFYLNLGTIVGYGFYNFIATNSDAAFSSAWDNNYSMIRLRPYLCIGFNIHSK